MKGKSGFLVLRVVFFGRFSVCQEGVPVSIFHAVLSTKFFLWLLSLFPRVPLFRVGGAGAGGSAFRHHHRMSQEEAERLFAQVFGGLSLQDILGQLLRDERGVGGGGRSGAFSRTASEGKLQSTCPSSSSTSSADHA